MVSPIQRHFRWGPLDEQTVKGLIQLLAGIWQVHVSRIRLEKTWKDEDGGRQRQPIDIAGAASLGEGEWDIGFTTSLGPGEYFSLSLSVAGGAIQATLVTPSQLVSEKTFQAVEDGLGLEPIESAGVSVVGFDTIAPDLWEHVSHLVETRQWRHIAGQTAIFVEDQLRTFGSRPADDVGVHLMTEMFHPDRGAFPLGATRGEREGWHKFAMGFVQALRNADTHRMQTRSDMRRYAFGVIGAGSLLLTQLHHQYGGRSSST